MNQLRAHLSDKEGLVIGVLITICLLGGLLSGVWLSNSMRTDNESLSGDFGQTSYGDKAPAAMGPVGDAFTANAQRPAMRAYNGDRGATSAVRAQTLPTQSPATASTEPTEADPTDTATSPSNSYSSLPSGGVTPGPGDSPTRSATGTTTSSSTSTATPRRITVPIEQPEPWVPIDDQIPTNMPLLPQPEPTDSATVAPKD